MLDSSGKGTVTRSGRGKGTGGKVQMSMTEQARIRQATEADIPRTGEFYDRVVRRLDETVNYPRWIYGVYPGRSFAREMTLAGAQYLCLEGETILGAFVLNTDPQGDYRRGRWSRDLPDGTFMVLHALAVDPSARRRQTASRIIRFCADTAKARGFAALRADIVPSNLPARRLFEKNGFACAGDADLGRGLADIPCFSLYELNF